jgi:hypothetical protein
MPEIFLVIKKGRPERKVASLATHYELIVWTMWEPRLLTCLWASSACYRDSLTFSYYDVWCCNNDVIGFVKIIIVIISLFSFLGHTMSNSPGFNMYASTKHTVTTLAESLRRELVQLETPVRVSVSRNGNVTSPPTSPLVNTCLLFQNAHLLRSPSLSYLVLTLCG